MDTEKASWQIFRICEGLKYVHNDLIHQNLKPDSVTGEVFYNPADERIALFAKFFKPEFDQERFERFENVERFERFENVERFVLDKFEMEDYVWLEDVVSKSGEVRDIMHRAFTGLVDAGGTGCGGSRMWEWLLKR
ncbi:MAG: hypothetical protein EF812_03935 [Methanosarcinales archaeon]|nr:MAG: hypothetical protein EF812_03935 [Methanosarcinales archaeon]